MTATLCATCCKPCYPTEKVMVSDLWIHKAGCLKCSVCSTTLSLSSVYVAVSSESPSQRALYCAKDVPKVVHTSIVDSLALRTAMSAPNPTTAPKGAFASKKKTSGKSIRFKGLTLRSRSIKAGLEAPKLDIKGLMKNPIVIGQAPGSPLGCWDIAHAMSVQSQVSSPIRDHPAIHAQRTGSSAGQWPMPTQPVDSQMTGTGDMSSDVSKAGRDDIEMEIKPDLVKNLIKVFQLDTVDRVILDSTRTPANTPSRPKRGHPLAAPSDIDMFALEGEGGVPKFANYAPTVSMHGSISSSTLRTLGTLGSRRGTVRKRTPLCEIFANPPEEVEQAQELYEARKAMRLLERLLPLAAHLIPLPADVDEDESYDGSDDLEEAREGLVRELEQKGLELVMLFEEEPLPLSAVQSPTC